MVKKYQDSWVQPDEEWTTKTPNSAEARELQLEVQQI